MCKGMKEVSLKDAQKSLQSCITWTKKSGKGRQEWDRACIDAGLPSYKEIEDTCEDTLCLQGGAVPGDPGVC